MGNMMYINHVRVEEKEKKTYPIFLYHYSSYVGAILLCHIYRTEQNKTAERNGSI